MTEKQEKPAAKRVAIEIPKELEAVYANMAFITHTPAEVVLDFVQVLPRMPKGYVKSRIVMSPMHAKMLQAALAQNLANFERQFGEIRVPQSPSLADELFRFPPAGDSDEEPDDQDNDDKE